MPSHTVNTAARMESTGSPGQIQVSHATANNLIAHNREHWLTRRDDSVLAKGKGVLDTYWLVPTKNSKHRGGGGNEMFSDELNAPPPESAIVPPSPSKKPSIASASQAITTTMKEDDESRKNRLIDWMVQLLVERIRAVVARNMAIKLKHDKKNALEFTRSNDKSTICLDETVDMIKLSKFDARADIKSSKVSSLDDDASNAKVPPEVISQLRDCITQISNTYRSNPFHNFDHACHVTLCVDKFLKRIVQPDVDTTKHRNIASALHGYTHGITSDPLAILAIVFSALVHDADHRGISNTQLCKEDEGMAKHYRGKSVAEQNSLDLTW